MRKIRILVVSPPALSQIIKHLLVGSPEFEVVGTVPGLRGIAEGVGRLLPELILANVKPVGTCVCSTVLSIKRASPLSKLLLITPLTEWIDKARRCGADACLDPEKLVQRLVPAISALSAGMQIQKTKKEVRHATSTSV